MFTQRALIKGKAKGNASRGVGRSTNGFGRRIPAAERLERRDLLSAEGLGVVPGAAGDGASECVVAAAQVAPQASLGDCLQQQVCDQTPAREQLHAGEPAPVQLQVQTRLRSDYRPPARVPIQDRDQLQQRDGDCTNSAPQQVQFLLQEGTVVAEAAPVATADATGGANAALFSEAAAAVASAVAMEQLGALNGDTLQTRDRDCTTTCDATPDQERTQQRLMDSDCEAIQTRDRDRLGDQTSEPQGDRDQTRTQDQLHEDLLPLLDQDRVRDQAFACLVE
jgi:hypothetical protein